MHIHVVAPASAAPIQRLNTGLDWLEKMGHQVELPKDLMKPRLFFAAPLKTQVDLFKQSFKSKAKVLWCLCGGYGSARLIPYLEKMKPLKQNKMFIGYSDITALHLYFTQVWKWKTIHGRVLTSLDGEANYPDLKLYQELLEGSLKEITYPKLTAMNEAAKKKQTLKGVVTGGNLRLLECSIGTAWELEAQGKILFLEDIGERGYAIHRMLLHIAQAGLLEGVKAIVLGDFTEGLEPDGSDRKMEALKAFAEEIEIPVFSGMPCGHGEKNWPLPFNTPATLVCGAKGVLTVTT